jgi:phosphopantetheinyl transferase
MAFLPLIKVKNQSNIGIWKIEESIQDLIGYCVQNKVNIDLLHNIKHEEKKKQYLASRLALFYTCELLHITKKEIVKDIHGKPFLSDSQHHVSISHSKYMACCAIDPNHNIGFDIEYVQPKIINIVPKVLSKEEQQRICNNVELATKYWSIKEAAYKLNGKKGVSFSQEILINPTLDFGKIQKINFKIDYLEIVYEHVFSLLSEE